MPGTATPPLPTTPPHGRAAVVVGRSEGGEPLLSQVAALGYAVDGFADPYTAFAAVCRRPLVYRAVVLALGGLYREELSVIAAARGRYGHVEVWLAQTDGRPAALAEGVALGAAAILGDDGLHRLAPAPPPPVARASAPIGDGAANGSAIGRANGGVKSNGTAPAGPRPTAAVPHRRPSAPVPVEVSADDDALLTAAELRALLSGDGGDVRPGEDD